MYFPVYWLWTNENLENKKQRINETICQLQLYVGNVWNWNEITHPYESIPTRTVANHIAERAAINYIAEQPSIDDQHIKSLPIWYQNKGTNILKSIEHFNRNCYNFYHNNTYQQHSDNVHVYPKDIGRHTRLVDLLSKSKYYSTRPMILFQHNIWTNGTPSLFKNHLDLQTHFPNCLLVIIHTYDNTFTKWINWKSNNFEFNINPFPNSVQEQITNLKENLIYMTEDQYSRENKLGLQRIREFLEFSTPEIAVPKWKKEIGMAGTSSLETLVCDAIILTIY